MNYCYSDMIFFFTIRISYLEKYKEIVCVFYNYELLLFDYNYINYLRVYVSDLLFCKTFFFFHGTIQINSVSTLCKFFFDVEQFSFTVALQLY